MECIDLRLRTNRWLDNRPATFDDIKRNPNSWQWCEARVASKSRSRVQLSPIDREKMDIYPADPDKLSYIALPAASSTPAVDRGWHLWLHVIIMALELGQSFL
jgi:hypothetical protein